MGAFNRPRIEAYIGASGSGKGVSIRRRLHELAPPRLVVWDPRGEYGSIAPAAAGLVDLVRQVKASNGKPFRVRFSPGPGVDLAHSFALLCQVAFEYGDMVFLAEELSDVTSPSWAPQAWRVCITQGRHKGLHILGAAQRPALIDKTFLSNCTRLRCGVLGYEPDRRVMAAELDVTRHDLADLSSTELAGGGARLVLIERDRQAGTVERVTLTVNRGGRATESRVSMVSGPLRGAALQAGGNVFPMAARGHKLSRVKP